MNHAVRERRGMRSEEESNELEKQLNYSLGSKYSMEEEISE